nr:protein kinase-like domain, phloem protein 2-like protein [Tanacetum cinerariifolium]
MSSSPNYDHLKIPLKDILSATNNFADENLIEEADIGNVYRGELLWSGDLIQIDAQRWLNKEWDDEIEQQFWMEISMLSTLKLETRASLENYLSDSRLLTWVRRLSRDCLNEERPERPNIDEIVTRLEKALEHHNAYSIAKPRHM